MVAELFRQSERHSEGSAESPFNSNILSQQNHAFIAPHFLAQSFFDRLDHGDFPAPGFLILYSSICFTHKVNSKTFSRLGSEYIVQTIFGFGAWIMFCLRNGRFKFALN